MTTSAIAETVRAASRSRRGIRVRGAGTWLHAGRPVESADTISTVADRGIVEYVPGDLTLTARAGTPLAELVEATRANEQWLPLDPWGGDAGTLGATISTASAGPHAHAFGLPRDVVLGMEFVSGTGDVVRSGGRVVKNVAGFDLTRLMVGSWGTLGVITEVTVRLRARPAGQRTVLMDAGTGAAALDELATRLRTLPFTPMAAELVEGRLATTLGLGDRDVVILRVGGNPTSVLAQLDALRAVGRMTDAPSGIWRALRQADSGADGVWRWSSLPSRFGRTWMAALDATRDLDVRMHGSLLRGVVRVIARGDGVRLAAAAHDAHSTERSVVIESLPGSGWASARSPVPDRVVSAIRARFDPGGILNPGILGGSA